MSSKQKRQARNILDRATRFIESLEDRRLLASISGTVWNDRNADGIRQADVEPLLSGRTIYIDTNDNAVLDAGEPSRSSNASGAYTFGSLPAGTYVVRQVVPAGWRSVLPVDPDMSIRRTLTAAQNSADVHFGSAFEVVSFVEQLSASDARTNDGFSGYGLARLGNTLFVASYSADDGATDKGAVYTFTLNAQDRWIESGKLDPGGLQAEDFFGISLKVAPGPINQLLVGAYKDDEGATTDSGCVYVFNQTSPTSWTFSQKLRSSDAAAGDGFGGNMSVSGNTLVVGAQSADAHAVNTGAAYTFVRDAAGLWTQTQKIVPSQLVANNYFGASAIDGDTIAFGNASYNGERGGVFVYQRNTSGVWEFDALLQRANLQPSHYMGSGIGIRGNLIAVGTPNWSNRGVVDIYARSGPGQWQAIQEILPTSSPTQGYFGGSLHMAEDGMWIAEHLSDIGGQDRGLAHFYRASGDGKYGLASIVSSPTPSDYEIFGAPQYSLGQFLAIGSEWADPRGISSAGALNIFKAQYAGHIRGNVFADRNGDGVRGAEDPVLGGRTVYLDADDDGILDAGETSLVTDSSGNYEFQNLAPGNYIIRQILPGNFGQTSPVGWQAGRSVTVASGQTLLGVDFGSAVQVLWPRQRILYTGGAGQDLFGQSPSISGQYMSVGAGFSDEPGSPVQVDRGSAYIYKRVGNGWTQIARILAPDGVAGDAFGHVTALDGDTLALSAATATTNSLAAAGAVYIYKRTSGDNWTFQTKLAASDPQAGANFGFNLTLKNGQLVVGAPNWDAPGAVNAGKVYVFVEEVAGEWIQTQVLTGDASANAIFGWHKPELSGNRLVIAANGEASRGTANDGAVYIFESSGGVYTRTAKLTPTTEPVSDNRFGSGIALDGDWLAVGMETYARGGAQQTGRMAIFRRISSSNWQRVSTLEIPEGQAFDRFGASAAFVNGTLLVAAWGADAPAVDSGKIYGFRFDGQNTWTRIGWAGGASRSMALQLPSAPLVVGEAETTVRFPCSTSSTPLTSPASHSTTPTTTPRSTPAKPRSPTEPSSWTPTPTACSTAVKVPPPPTQVASTFSTTSSPAPTAPHSSRPTARVNHSPRSATPTSSRSPPARCSLGTSASSTPQQASAASPGTTATPTASAKPTSSRC
jgi:hypothetical protein